MKFTEQELRALAIAIAPTIAGWKLCKTPKARDGSSKDVSPDFAAAVWTKRYVETFASVFEKERDEKPAESSSSGSGFP